MGDWKVWFVAFLGFAAMLGVGVSLIAVDILSAHTAQRRYAARHRDIKRSPPLRPRSRVAMVVRRVAIALLMLAPVLVVGAAVMFGITHLAELRPG
jgi:hypothetical protein